MAEPKTVSFTLPGEVTHMQNSGLLAGLKPDVKPAAATGEMEITFEKGSHDYHLFVDRFKASEKRKGFLYDHDADHRNGNEVYLSSQIVRQITITLLSQTGKEIEIGDHLAPGQLASLNRIIESWPYTKEESKTVDGQRLAIIKHLANSGQSIHFWDADNNPDTMNDFYWIPTGLYEGLAKSLDIKSEPIVYPGLKKMEGPKKNHNYYPILVPLDSATGQAVIYKEQVGKEKKPVADITHFRLPAGFRLPEDWTKLKEFIESTPSFKEDGYTYRLETDFYRVVSIDGQNIPVLELPIYERSCEVATDGARDAVAVKGAITFNFQMKHEELSFFTQLMELVEAENSCVYSSEIMDDGRGGHLMKFKTHIDVVMGALSAVEKALALKKKGEDLLPPPADKIDPDIKVRHALAVLAQLNGDERDTFEKALKEYQKQLKALGTIGDEPSEAPMWNWRSAVILAAILAVAGYGTHKLNQMDEGIGKKISVLIRGWLKTYGTDMNKLYGGKARAGTLAPFKGRDSQLSELFTRITRRGERPRSAILLGNPGSGKSSIVEFMASEIGQGKIAELNGYEIWKIDASGFSGKGKLSGGADNVRKVAAEILRSMKKGKQIILFVDEIHLLLDVDKHSTSTQSDVVEILKDRMIRGEITVIGATTRDEYERHFLGISGSEKYPGNPPFAERFGDPIYVPDPEGAFLREIVQSHMERLEKDYELKFERTAEGEIAILEKAILVSEHRNPNRAEPRRSIDLVQDVLDFVRIKKMRNPADTTAIITVDHLWDYLEQENQLKKASVDLGRAVKRSSIARKIIIPDDVWNQKAGESREEGIIRRYKLIGRALRYLSENAGVPAHMAQYIPMFSVEEVGDVSLRGLNDGQRGKVTADLVESIKAALSNILEETLREPHELGIQNLKTLDESLKRRSQESWADYKDRLMRVKNAIEASREPLTKPEKSADAKRAKEEALAEIRKIFQTNRGDTVAPANESKKPAKASRHRPDMDLEPTSRESLIRTLREAYGAGVFERLGIVDLDQLETTEELLEALRRRATKQSGLSGERLVEMVQEYAEQKAVKPTLKQVISLYVDLAEGKRPVHAWRQAMKVMERRLAEKLRVEKDHLRADERERLERERERLQRWGRRAL